MEFEKVNTTNNASIGNHLASLDREIAASRILAQRCERASDEFRFEAHRIAEVVGRPEARAAVAKAEELAEEARRLHGRVKLVAKEQRRAKRLAGSS